MVNSSVNKKFYQYSISHGGDDLTTVLTPQWDFFYTGKITSLLKQGPWPNCVTQHTLHSSNKLCWKKVAEKGCLSKFGSLLGWVLCYWRVIFPPCTHSMTWWSHQMETFSVVLGLCERNPSAIGGFPTQRPATWSFDVFFELRLNRRLSKESRRRWFEMPLHSLWRHCNDSLSLCYQLEEAFIQILITENNVENK